MKTELRQINLQERIWKKEKELGFLQSSSAYENDYDPDSNIYTRRRILNRTKAIHSVIISWIIYINILATCWFLSITGGAWSNYNYNSNRVLWWADVCAVLALMGTLGLTIMVAWTCSILE